MGEGLTVGKRRASFLLNSHQCLARPDEQRPVGNGWRAEDRVAHLVDAEDFELGAVLQHGEHSVLAGDEDFAILGVGWFFPGDVENAAKRFILKIQEPLPSIGGQLMLPASMGIAIAQPDEPIAMILRRAQRARKMAWELGAGRVYVDNGPGREPTKA